MSPEPGTLLVVSDMSTVRSLCARAAHAAGLTRVRYALPGEAAAVSALREFAPTVVVVEVRFPGREHVELAPLRAVRDVVGAAVSPAVVVMTSSDDPALERRVHGIGVDALWRLPIDVHAFRESLSWLAHRAVVARADDAAPPRGFGRIDEGDFQVCVQTGRPERGGVLEALFAAQELVDPGLAAHAQRVAYRALTLCRALDLSPGYVHTIVAGALLHDMGHMVGSSEGRRAGAALEARTVTGETMEHVAAANDLLGRLGLPVPSGVREVVAHHHERWDGHGRPTGYAAHEIPFAARIVATCDAFDHAAHDAAQALRPDDVFEVAMERIGALAGSVLDPDLVDAFVAMVAGEAEERGVLEIAAREHGRGSRSRVPPG